MDLISNLLAAMPVFLFSLVFHEYAHALAAYRLGDKTAAWSGRLTLDPRAHIDPVGSIAMPAIGLVVGFVFGWAKPVPYNPANLRNPSRDQLLIAIAGPVSNLILLVVVALLLRALPALSGVLPASVVEALYLMGAWGVVINAILAAFNMIPLPPLDGSKVLAHFLPYDAGWKLLSLDPNMSMIAILALVFTGVLTPVLVALQGLASVIAGLPPGVLY
jgi:Zn-dependent protease